MDDFERSADDELLDLFLSGDRGAFVHLSQRHLGLLYDLVLRTTLDIGLAEAAVRAGLQQAATAAADWPGATTVQAWLLGLVRTKALDSLRPRSRSQTDSGLSLDPMDGRFYALADSGADHALAGWAWESVRAQRPKDYTLIDLMVRRELTAEEIADVADLPRSSVFGTLGRLRGAVEETFAVTVLFYRGRANCSVLDDLSGDATDLSTPLRRDLSRHLTICRDCRELSDRYGSPAALFAAFLPLEPDETLRNAIAGSEEPRPVDTAQAALPLDLAVAGVATAGGAASAAVEATEEPASLAWGNEAGSELIDDSNKDALEDMSVEEPPDSDEQVPPPKDETAAAPRVARFDSPAGRRETLLRLDRDGLLDGGEPPPRLPLGRIGGWFGGSPSRTVLLFVFVALTALGAYLGYAIGDSIEGGGNDESSGDATVVVGIGDLPTRTPGLREIACGAAPIEIQPGFKTRLNLASTALTGYEIASGPIIEPLSGGATAQSIDVQAEQGLSVVVEAFALSAPGATDEYRIELTFEKERSDDIVADCLVNVVSQESAVPPTSVAGTPEPTETATEVPPTTVPVQPTQAPAQPSQPLPTATPSGPPPTPTRDPNSFIPTWTPVPPTVTPTPVPSNTPTQ